MAKRPKEYIPTEKEVQACMSRYSLTAEQAREYLLLVANPVAQWPKGLREYATGLSDRPRELHLLFLTFVREGTEAVEGMYLEIIRSRARSSWDELILLLQAEMVRVMIEGYAQTPGWHEDMVADI